MKNVSVLIARICVCVGLVACAVSFTGCTLSDEDWFEPGIRGLNAPLFPQQVVEAYAYGGGLEEVVEVGARPEGILEVSRDAEDPEAIRVRALSKGSATVFVRDSRGNTVEKEVTVEDPTRTLRVEGFHASKGTLPVADNVHVLTRSNIAFRWVYENAKGVDVTREYLDVYEAPSLALDNSSEDSVRLERCGKGCWEATTGEEVLDVALISEEVQGRWDLHVVERESIASTFMEFHPFALSKPQPSSMRFDGDVIRFSDDRGGRVGLFTLVAVDGEGNRVLGLGGEPVDFVWSGDGVSRFDPNTEVAWEASERGLLLNGYTYKECVSESPLGDVCSWFARGAWSVLDDGGAGTLRVTWGDMDRTFDVQNP